MASRTSLFYDRLVPVYPVIDLFLRKQRHRLIMELNAEKPGRLLEIGVGTGTQLSLYRHHEVTGIDVSKGMLRVAARHAPPGVRLMEMDGQQLGFSDASFCYVVLAHVIAVADDPNRMIDEVYRVLRPGGKCFILNHFSPQHGLGYIDRLFRPAGRLLHFRSRFTTDDLPSLKQFSLLSRKAFFPGGYFQLLILRKQ